MAGNDYGPKGCRGPSAALIAALLVALAVLLTGLVS